MKKFYFLNHTGEIKFRAIGRTFEEALVNSALATSSVMWDWEKVEKKIEYRVEVDGRDIKQLLVNFLEEILFLFDSQRFLLCSVENIRIKKKKSRHLLEAIFVGDKLHKKYRTKGNVKAITYSEMKIGRNDHFIIQVVLDV